jgi:NADH-quinone oxidoreductase subunit N
MSVGSTGKYIWLVIFAVLCAAVSVYYYFRVIQAMYFKDGGGGTENEPSAGFKGLLVLLAVLVIVLGVFPQALLHQLTNMIYTW